MLRELRGCPRICSLHRKVAIQMILDPLLNKGVDIFKHGRSYQVPTAKWWNKICQR
jgi:hypothetical protein